MARIRTIKPEFQNSADMGAVSREARLTFILLWPQCDDEGRIRAHSRMLASVLYPYDEDAPNLIDGWLEELENHGCIVRYVVDNEKYLAVTSWHHQKIDHPTPSKLPAPPSKKPRKQRRTTREASESTSEASDNPRPVSSTVSDRISTFDAFWNECPRKQGKGAAEVSFQKAVKAGVGVQTMIDAMRRYAASRVGQDAKYTCLPATWLNQERWTDELPDAPKPAEQLSPERLAELQDIADRIKHRGKYAPGMEAA